MKENAMTAIKTTFIILLMIALMLSINANGQSTSLDSCKREYIALSRSYEDLKQDYADVVYINSMDKIYAQKAHEKQLKKAKRKRWFNGFLWGNVIGILALAVALK